MEIIRKINVDFYDKKLITINAKQYDSFSRYISISCYNQGEFVFIDSKNRYAFVRYKKADGNNAFNQCIITKDGRIMLELTEQMLTANGYCYADVLIVTNNPVETPENPITENTGKLIYIDNDSILSTMTFCIVTTSSAVDNVDIESSDEYNGLNDLIIKATEDYTYVMSACKVSEDNAKVSENNAKTSELNAKDSENKAKVSEENAKTSEDKAKVSEDNAKVSEENAKMSEGKAKASEESAIAKALEAEQFAAYASNKADEASDSALLSKSYAVGNTGVRDDENTDNAKYYFNQAKFTCDSLGATFKTMGTIKFSDLKSVEADTGYVYHISEEFVTDDTFKEGTGVTHAAGTNIYYTYDGYWDCFTGDNIVILDSTATLIAEDDGNGCVIIGFSNSIPTDDVDVINQAILELQQRIKLLEEQNVLGITE